MAIITVQEYWELTAALAIPKRGMTNVTISPLPNDCTVTNTKLFIVFSTPLEGEFMITGDIDESALLTNKPPDLANTLAELRNIGITSVSGFNDLSVSFDNKAGATNTPAAAAAALLPNTYNTFFARLLSSEIVGTAPPAQCVEFEIYATTAGEDYTSPTPLIPLQIIGSAVSKVSWADVELCDVLALPLSAPQTTLECYAKGSKITVSGLVAGKNYFWVDGTFQLVPEPLPPTATKTFWVGTALTQNTLNLTLNLLFED